MKTQHRMDTGRRKSKEKSRENYLGSQKESRGDTAGNKENMNYMDARRIWKLGLAYIRRFHCIRDSHHSIGLRSRTHSGLAWLRHRLHLANPI
jgi:hypothetical protein